MFGPWPVAGGPDADQTQRMVALLIDGLRYAARPHDEVEHRLRRPETTPWCCVAPAGARGLPRGGKESKC